MCGTCALHSECQFNRVLYWMSIFRMTLYFWRFHHNMFLLIGKVLKKTLSDNLCSVTSYHLVLLLKTVLCIPVLSSGFFFSLSVCTFVFRDSLDSPPEEGSQKSSLILSLPRFPILSRPSLPKGWAEKSFLSEICRFLHLFSAIFFDLCLAAGCITGWGKRSLRFLNSPSWRHYKNYEKLLTLAKLEHKNCTVVMLFSSSNVANIKDHL